MDSLPVSSIHSYVISYQLVWEYICLWICVLQGGAVFRAISWGFVIQKSMVDMAGNGYAYFSIQAVATTIHFQYQLQHHIQLSIMIRITQPLISTVYERLWTTGMCSLDHNMYWRPCCQYKSVFCCSLLDSTCGNTLRTILLCQFVPLGQTRCAVSINLARAFSHGNTDMLSITLVYIYTSDEFMYICMANLYDIRVHSYLHSILP